MSDARKELSDAVDALTLHGFPYSAEVEAHLKSGWHMERAFTDAAGHRHRVTLSWNHSLGMPSVTSVDLDLAARIVGPEEP